MNRNQLTKDKNHVNVSGIINHIIYCGEKHYKFRLRIRRGEFCSYVLCVAFKDNCDTFDSFVPQKGDRVEIIGGINSFKNAMTPNVDRVEYEMGIQIYEMTKTEYVETIPMASLLADKEPTFDDDIPF